MEVVTGLSPDCVLESASGDAARHPSHRAAEGWAERLTTWVAALLLLGAGCFALDLGFTEISEIVKNPSRFDGKEVKVKGKVVDVLKIPLVETKLYTMKDESGDLVVVTGKELPSMDAQVRVKGTIQTVAIIGGKSLGLHLVESERW